MLPTKASVNEQKGPSTPRIMDIDLLKRISRTPFYGRIKSDYVIA